MKTLVVRSKNKSNWKSCVTITDGLSQLYSNWPIFGIDRLNNESYFIDIEELKATILNEKIQKLVFIDHDPTAPRILNDLIKNCGNLNLKQVAIHVFGDFTYFAEEWFLFFKQNFHFNIQLYVASSAQKKLIETFIDGISIDIVPFLIPENIQFDQTKRLKFRTKLNLSSDEVVFLYTGRISLQKNTLQLLVEFDRFSKDNENVRLLVIGEFDDRGFSYLNASLPLGYMHTKIFEQKIFENKKISFIGNLQQDELEEYYLAADVFVSLSTYHDEDFGMSALEALGYGLPVILSDWGGYHDFLTIIKEKNNHFSYPVDIQMKHGLQINLIDLRNAFKNIILKRETIFLERERISLEVKKIYSHLNINLERNSNINNKQLIITDLFEELVQSQKIALRNKEMNQKLLPDSELYNLIYSNYTFNSSDDNWTSIDYVENILEASYSRNQFSMQEKNLLPFEQCFSPFRDFYHSYIPTVFLSNIDNSSQLSKQKEWVVRDGSVLVLDFFKRCQPLNYILIIPKDFVSLVPGIWREHVLFYDYFFQEKNNSGKKILSCMPKESFSRINFFYRKIDQWVNREDDIYAFFPIRKKDFFVKEKTERYFDYAKYLWKSNERVEFVDWYRAQSFENMQYAEINDHRYLYDSYPLHYFASRKCSILRDDNNKKHLNAFQLLKTIPLSLYHSIIIEKVNYDLYELDNKFINEIESELIIYRKNIENYNPIFEQ